MTGRDRLILALDLPDAKEALACARTFKGKVGLFKIGLQLFTVAGPDIVARIVSEAGPVFLDLKFHDIPRTVALAVRSAAGTGATMLTVHAAGGTEMLRAASEAASEADPRTKILAVTVLTSLAEDDLAAAGVVRTIPEQVAALAEMAWVCGCDGVVASPLEVAALRRQLGPEALIVTPGIRTADASQDDQKRTAGPREAVDAGADFLVLGRTILAADDPLAALEKLAASLQDT